MEGKTILDDKLFLKQLNSSPVGSFLFFGEEDYTKNYCLDMARKAVITDPAFALFNETVLDGNDLDLDMLKSAVETLPFMADNRLIVVRPFRPDLLKKEEAETLCDILAQAQNSQNLTILACPNDVSPDDKKNSVFQELSQYLTPVAFRKSTPDRLAVWVQKHFAANNVNADKSICDALIRRCGTSMYPLSLEIDKISYFVLASGRTAVAPQDLEEVSTKDASVGAFDLSNALLAKKKDDALRILQNLRFNKEDPIKVLSMVSSVFCDQLEIRALMEEGMPKSEIAASLKMHEYKTGLYMNALRNVSVQDVRNILKICSDADALIKKGRSGFEALEYLVCAI